MKIAVKTKKCYYSTIPKFVLFEFYSSLLTDDKLDIHLNPEGNVTVQSTSYDIVFISSVENHEEPQILIPKDCPIPIRKSHHLPIGKESVSAKVFLKKADKLIELVEV